MTLAALTKGFDSGRPIDPVAAHNAGGRYQFRYSAGAGNGNANTQWKLCGVNEIAQIRAAGNIFIANSEWYETRCEEGAAAGAADGAADLKFWQSRSLPKGSSIYISWDTAPNAAKYQAVKAYIEAYNRALNGYYVADGFYAGIPALVWMSVNSITRHGWVPEGASFSVPKTALDPHYAPPAVSSWDLWFPTPSQVAPAVAWINARMAGHRLVSCVWQNGNKAFNNQADENIINIAGPLGGVGDTPAGDVPTSQPNPNPVPTPPSKKLYQGYPVPALIRQGSGQYFGSISGPAASHGGFNAGEKNLVKILQQRLIVCGFVPGQTNPNSGWADGVFDTPRDAPGTGATSQAVARFQRAHMPGTKFFGQVWYDDWTKLFNL